MNIEEYISSGILEAYVMGELTDRERVEVERMVAAHPEVKKELLLIEETQEKLLMSAGIAPPQHVKDLLFIKIAGEPESDIRRIEISTSEVMIWRYAVAASVSIAVVAGALAYTYYSRWRQSENSLADMIAQHQRVAQDYNVVNQRLDKIESDIEVINNPAFKRVVMAGTPNAPTASAYVYWNEASKEVYLSVQNMKELSHENQYQLWAIIDGKPVDAGVFDGHVAGLLKMKDIGTGAVTFAVTVEPRGGKPAPTLETMQVAGNVKS